VAQLSSEVVGGAQFQLDARGPAGVSEGLVGMAGRVRGVRAALPLLESEAVVTGPHGVSRAVDLIGIDPRFAHLGGPVLKRFSTAQLAVSKSVVLPAPLADAIGVGPLETLNVQVGARVIPTIFGTALGEHEIGGLVNSPVALTPIRYAQQMTGMQGRVTRVFVQAAPGRDREVLTGLRRLAAADHVSIEPASFDARLFAVAESPEDQSETLFSAISAIVGFIFAVNAMLLTAPRRRRFLEHVRFLGANRTMEMQILLFDALALGLVACVIGIALGDVLSIAVLHSTPGYLSFAFPVGDVRVVTVEAVVIAVAAGMLAAIAGVLWPMRDVLKHPRRRVIPARWWPTARIATGLVCFAVTTVILFAFPGRSKLGSFTLVVSLLCALPFVFTGALLIFERLQPVLNRASPDITLTFLRSRPTRVLSLAIVAISGVALFGVVAIQGAQRNLQHGLDASAHDIDSSSDIWVSTRGESNAFATTPFTDPGAPRMLTRLPGIKSVSEYRGSFLNWGDRRLWVLAPPNTSTQPMPASELTTGNLALTDQRLRQGGWAVLSQALATENRLRVGDTFTLPSPNPTVFRVAALSTNLGWPPGALIVNSNDYAHAWANSNPSAYEIQTTPTAQPATVRQEITHALGPNTGLIVETATEREQRHYTLAAQGLQRLTQIKLLLIIAAICAIVGALGALVWQRRNFIEFVRCQGFTKGILWRWLLWESTILLAVGCWTGAMFGIYGQLLLSHALASVTGFPITFDIEPLLALTTFTLVTTTTLLLLALPGYLTVRVPPKATRPAS
jgi:putative ABC transport system permease protein